MYDLREDIRREFHSNLLRDFFRKYEANNYIKKERIQTQEKFVKIYMRKPKYDLQYYTLLKNQIKYENLKR